MGETGKATRGRARERIVTLNDPHAMRINKELAREIGFQESVVFLQVEFLISTKGRLRDGRLWVRLPLDELRDGHLPWWSTSTLSRVVHRLEERNLLRVDRSLNREGRDRTTWFAIDEEGVGELRSVAILQFGKGDEPEEAAGFILQDETPDPPENRQVADCNMQDVNLQDASRQNEKCIYIESSPLENFEERPPDGGPKKPEASSPLHEKPKGRTRVRKLDDEEAERLFDELCDSDAFGSELRSLARLLAAENATGEVAITRVWRELGERYAKARERAKLSKEAWAYGFDEAVSRSKPNIGYVVSAARGYRPPKAEANARRGGSSAGVAVIGATEEAYDGDL